MRVAGCTLGAQVCSANQWAHCAATQHCLAVLCGRTVRYRLPRADPCLPSPAAPLPPCCSCVAKFSMFWKLPDGAMGILNGMEEDSRPKLALDTPADVDAFFASKTAAKLAYQAAKGLQVGVRWPAVELTPRRRWRVGSCRGLRLNWRIRGCRRVHARQQPPTSGHFEGQPPRTGAP